MGGPKWKKCVVPCKKQSNFDKKVTHEIKWNQDKKVFWESHMKYIFGLEKIGDC